MSSAKVSSSLAAVFIASSTVCSSAASVVSSSTVSSSASSTVCSSIASVVCSSVVSSTTSGVETFWILYSPLTWLKTILSNSTSESIVKERLPLSPAISELS